MSAKAKVYVETTVVSYLTARKTRDLIAVAHQTVTRRWWRRRKRFDLYCSQIVVREAGALMMVRPAVKEQSGRIPSPALLAGEGEGEGTLCGRDRGTGCEATPRKLEPSPQSSPAGGAGEEDFSLRCAQATAYRSSARQRS